MSIDEYALKARFSPAFLTIIFPIMVFNHFYVSAEFSTFVGEIMGARLVSNLTISAICLYFFAEFGRLIGKNVFERHFFLEESAMPTTDFLLHIDSTFSAEYKKRFRDRIQSEFGLVLATVQEEAQNPELARTRIVEAMALVRKSLTESKALLQHNIEYGAMRNAIGGSVIGAVLSLANVWFFSQVVPHDLAVILSGVSLGLYALLIASSRIIIRFYGRNYAKILYRDYLGAR